VPEASPDPRVASLPANRLRVDAGKPHSRSGSSPTPRPIPRHAKRHESAYHEVPVHAAGPSPADADRIFQPFQRLDDRTSHDGSGLGLTIVASIAAIHGGIATVRPRNDGGLSVTVTIPSASTPAQGPGMQTDRDA
jgi:light-regulated signal transduction histidine kinase (bacteriophytochrome)